MQRKSIMNQKKPFQDESFLLRAYKFSTDCEKSFSSYTVNKFEKNKKIYHEPKKTFSRWKFFVIAHTDKTNQNEAMKKNTEIIEAMKKTEFATFGKKRNSLLSRGPKWYITRILRVSCGETHEIDGCTKKVQIRSSVENIILQCSSFLKRHVDH